MTKISAPLKILKLSEPPTQVMEKNEIVLKKEHRAIYDVFIKTLQNKAKSQMDLEIIDIFISPKDILFSDINQEKIKPLSEENFCQLLLSIFEKIREKKLAEEEKLNNDKIQQIITKCVDDIRGTEAKDSLIKLLGWPFGIKIDPKNISSSLMNGVKEKIPFLGGGKEEDEPPLSDEEMVTTFLRKIFLPAFVSIASILIFGPTTLAIVAAAIGAIFAVKGGLEVLFSNNKPGTLYNPHSQDNKEKEEWDGKILEGINAILKTQVKGAGKGNQSDVTGEEQLAQAGNRQPNAELGQISVDQLGQENMRNESPAK